jgi:integrase-like protein
MKKAGLEGVSLHSLRHTHASELLSSGVPIPPVVKRLAHANASITLSIYAHAPEADEPATAKIWNDAIADVIGAHKRQPNRNPGISSGGKPKNPKLLKLQWVNWRGRRGSNPRPPT